MYQTKRRKLVSELSSRHKRRLVAVQNSFFSKKQQDFIVTPTDSNPSTSKEDSHSVSPVEQEKHSSESEANSEKYMDNDNTYIQVESSIPNSSFNVGYNFVSPLAKDIEKLAISLRSCFNKHNISQSAISDILKVLVEHGVANLPLDARTLMKTQRNVSSEIDFVNGGQYCHVGVTDGLISSIKKYYKVCPLEIKLDFNIDGLPVSKSTNGQFWPILAAIHDEFYSQPFPVGIYYGNSKPSDSNTFLKPFVEEMRTLLDQGLEYNGQNVLIKVNAIVCDSPARAFICGTKGHTGYFGCPKCETEGDFIENRVIFPELTAKLRTNSSFRNKTQPEHHKIDSILQELDIDMVSQIPLDPMHLVYLGVTKRLLQFWVQGRMGVRMNKTKLEESEFLNLELKKFIPNEFSRLPRPLSDVDRWKATEYRLFLLYTGIVVLRDSLPKAMYHHFLALSVSLRILSSTHLSHLVNYAEQNLKYFVQKYSTLYGDQYLSFNTHCLIHLCNEVRNFGPIHNFSAFKFENYMYQIKQKLKTSGKPLHQIVNRLKEAKSLDDSLQKNKSYPEYHISGTTVKLIEFSNYSISCKKPNNCCMLKSGRIIIIENMCIECNKVLITYRYFTKYLNLFSVPCQSSLVGIFSVSFQDLSGAINVEFAVDLFSSKCLLFPNVENKYVVMKMVHC